VWATEQEDPAKTIYKWKKLKDGQGQVQQQDREQQQQEEEGGGDSLQQQQQQQRQQDAAAGPDYLVPWHVPFHRAGGLLKKQQQQQQQQQEAGSAAAADHQQAGSSQSAAEQAAAAAAGSIRVDQSKGAVVLQRYYHLFDQGELEGLVADVPGVAVVDVFYDRSNWCVVFEKR
jgi:alkylated DNA repair protein alkB family protein 8